MRVRHRRSGATGTASLARCRHALQISLSRSGGPGCFISRSTDGAGPLSLARVHVTQPHQRLPRGRAPHGGVYPEAAWPTSPLEGSTRRSKAGAQQRRGGRLATGLCAAGQRFEQPHSEACRAAGRAQLADIKQAETVLEGSLIRILGNRICPVKKRRLKPISLGLPLAGNQLLRLEEGKHSLPHISSELSCCQCPLYPDVVSHRRVGGCLYGVDAGGVPSRRLLVMVRH
mmetsp:Transcript_61417/g.168652  ORF Transcript_61417/g.168652 Transcript_61417/m.168652 type:complete len:230 (-) Transcript_61417:747-1436(-)